MFPISALRAWGSFWFLGLEAHQVIGLRMMKIAAGGAAAEREALRMVTEKVEAAQHTVQRLALGASPQEAMQHYSGRVRANRRRLLRK